MSQPADVPNGPEATGGAARPSALSALQVARTDGTGVGFPAAVRAHVLADPAAALEEARGWGASPDADDRLVAVEVLGALASPWSPAPAERVLPVLLEQAGAAASAPQDDLRWVAAKVLAHAGPDGVPALLGLAGDPDGDVRWQAVSSLPLVAGSPPSPEVVQGLLQALGDGDAEVRDQAVFGLGLQLDADTPAVRDALAAHLDDERGDTAAQAARALAQRGDERVLEVLQRRLAPVDEEALADLEDGWVEAAADLADARLLPVLQALRARPDLDAAVLEEVDTAIAACSAS